MRRRLQELVIRGRIAAADLAPSLVARARSARGQTTVEWIALMVGLAALVTVLAGDDVWREAGRAIVQAVRDIVGDSHDRV